MTEHPGPVVAKQLNICSIHEKDKYFFFKGILLFYQNIDTVYGGHAASYSNILRALSFWI